MPKRSIGKGLIVHHAKLIRSAVIAATTACGTFFGTALLARNAAWAQADYPSKNVTFIVPFAAGGATDSLTRIVAEGLASELGAKIICRKQTWRLQSDWRPVCPDPTS
jgi:hypothetical protein